MNRSQSTARIGQALALLVVLVLAALLAFALLRPPAAAPGRQPCQGYPTPATLGESDPTRDEASPAPPGRASAAREVILWGSDSIPSLYQLDVFSNTLVSAARDNGGVSVVMVDLSTGCLERIASVIYGGVLGLRIWDRYVAWADDDRDRSGDVRQIHLFDRVQMQGQIVWHGVVGELDMNDGLLVWREHERGGWALRSLELGSGQIITISNSAPSPGQLRVCSRSWIAYLQSVPVPEPTYVDLRALNLSTGEELALGRVPYEPTASFGKQHTCDGDKVAWIGSGYPTKLHLYDLASRTERVLDSTLGPGLPTLLLDNGLLIGAPGHGATDHEVGVDIVYDLLADLPLEQRTGGQMALSQGRVVWTAQAGANTVQRLFTALINR